MKRAIFAVLLLCVATLTTVLSSQEGTARISHNLFDFKGNKDIVIKRDANGKIIHARAYDDFSFPYKNIQYLGRGYDIMFGNPMTTDIMGDKGYRSPIFEVGADPNDERGTADWGNLLPKHVDVYNHKACDISTSQKEVSSSLALQEEISGAVSETHEASASGSYSGFGVSVSASFSAKFSGSSSFKQMANSMASSESVFVFSEAKCALYMASMNPFDYPKFTEAFLKAVRALPKQLNAESEPIYNQFVQTYGTHFVSKITFGARYGKVYEMTKSSYDSFSSSEKESQKSREISASASGSGYGAKFSASYGNSKDEKSARSNSRESKLSNMASNEYSYSIGADMAENPQDWAANTEKDPVPITIGVSELSSLVLKHVDRERGVALSQFYNHYNPPGTVQLKSDLGKCYVSRASHVIYDGHVSKRSLIARCPKDSVVIGGSFYHLWNAHGDVLIDDMTSRASKILDDLNKFQSLKQQSIEIAYLLKHGANMLKKFQNSEAAKKLEELIGSRIPPEMAPKFLRGELKSLNIKKAESLSSIANGLKLFGQTKLGDQLAGQLAKNPWTKALFTAGSSLIKGVAAEQSEEEGAQQGPQPQEQSQAQTLDIADATPLDVRTLTKEQAKVVEHHADVLVQFMKHLKKEDNSDETQTLFINKIVDFAKKVHNKLQELGSKAKDILAKLGLDNLGEWKFFRANIDSIWRVYGDKIRSKTKKIARSALFQDIMSSVEGEVEGEHGSTLLAQRNGLNWMFPHGEQEFVCASGVMGMAPTKRSSFGHCVAYCADTSSIWNVQTISSRKRQVDEKERTMTIEVSAPQGSTILSGGFLFPDYVEGRFIEVLENSPTDDNTYRCKIKWRDDVTTNPLLPRLKCYARIATPRTGSLQCKTVSTPLVNGEATSFCPATHQMAVGGGWKVSSHGVTYLKSVEYSHVDRYQGARAFTCAFGSSHKDILGSCVAQCCNVHTAGIENVAASWGPRCIPFYKRQGRARGSTIAYSDSLHPYQFLVSRNGKYFAWMDRFFRFYVGEMNGCNRVHIFGSIRFNGFRCLQQMHQRAAEKFPYPKANTSGWNWFRRRSIYRRVRRQVARQRWRRRWYINRAIHGTRLQITEDGAQLIPGDTDESCDALEVAQKSVNYVQLADNGNLIFYGDNEEGLKTYDWSKCRLFSNQVKAKYRSIHQGEMLTSTQAIANRRRNFVLYLEPAGFLTLYRQYPGNHGCHQAEPITSTSEKVNKAANDPAPGPNSLGLEHSMNTAAGRMRRVIEEENRHPKEGYVLRVGEDNDIKIYDSDGKVSWSSGTAGMGIGAATLRLTHSGQVLLEDAVGTMLWSLQTGKIHQCQSLRDRLKLRSHRLGLGHSLKPGVGGLLSRNKEYVAYIREDDHGFETSYNLELWRDSPDDCSSSRVCTLIKNVQQLDIQADGIKNQNGKAIFSFPNKMPVLRIDLEDNGHIYFSGGHHNRVEVKEHFVGECKMMPKVKTRNLSYDSEGCLNVRWEDFAQRGGWFVCPDNHVLKGVVTIGTQSARDLKSGRCCKSHHKLTCREVDWTHQFNDNTQTTVQCGSDELLAGFYTTSGNTLQSFTKGKCCKEASKPTKKKCHSQNMMSNFDKAGEHTCNGKNQFLKGITRSKCPQLFCLDGYVCCEYDNV